MAATTTIGHLPTATTFDLTASIAVPTERVGGASARVTVPQASLAPGTYTVAANLTLSTPLALAQGVVIRPAAGVTLTVSAPLTAARTTIFDLSASGSAVLLANQDQVYPEWFGVVANDLTAATANDAAMLKAVESTAPLTTSNGGRITLAPAVYHFGAPLRLNRRTWLAGINGSRGYISPATVSGGSTLTVPDGSDGVIVDYVGTNPVSGRGDASVLTDLRIVARGKTTGTGSGVVFKGRATCERVHTDGFKQDGFLIDASTSYTPPTNANLFRLRDCSAYNNGRDGLHVMGADANAGLVEGFDGSDNGGWGIYDDSFLGNTYVGCHTAGNGSGPYALVNAAAAGLLVGCYSESGQPASDVRPPSLVLGGLHAAGFTAASNTPQIGAATSGNSLALSALKTTNALGAISVTAQLGGATSQEEFFGFAASDDNGAGGYLWRYGKPATGWYGLIHSGVDSRVPFAVGGDQSTDLAGNSTTGQACFPNGLYLGSGVSMRHHVFGSAAPSVGKWTQGDIVFTTTPTSGGSIGWVCVTSGNFAGTPPVFKAFGTIA